MADLQELFSRLKATASESPIASQGNAQSPTPSMLWAQQSTHQPQSSLSTASLSPPLLSPNLIHHSTILNSSRPASMTSTPMPDQDRSNSLLNLLKFSQQPPTSVSSPLANLQNVGVSRSASGTIPTIQPRGSLDTRPLSAADLMATIQKKPQAPLFAQSASGQEQRENVTSQAASQQDFLLNLLKPKTQTSSQDSAIFPVDAKSEKSVEKAQALPDVLSSTTSIQPIFEAPQPTKPTIFNYVNPFDELHSSSPLNPAVKSGVSPVFEILKHERDVSTDYDTAAAAPVAKSRKLDPTTQAAAPGKDETIPGSIASATNGGADPTERKAKSSAKGNAAPSIAPSAPLAESLGPDNGIVNDDTPSSWESAEDEEKSDFAVDVYNFPMKPFVSIQIKSTPEAQPIRQDNFVVIAQLKKEFDQIDRCLVTSSQTHIVYAQVATKKDNGGFRIIRQDNGQHKQVFRSSGERVFSVQLCNSGTKGEDIETVLATGVNGTVFWTSLAKSRGDLFGDDDVESQGFVMPPVATAEENTSGSPVKTRAKMSSRHSQYFGVARGKQIYIIAPETVKDAAYCSMTDRKVDSEKFFAEHSLKINTGKAGKDFCFSEDDSVIVSLDKNGRFKFWDIRELTVRAGDINEKSHEPVELREPIWQMSAAASGSKPDEKPSVSSIMFLDKEKPTIKGAALRYMIIGFKQNHILQLWDLGLGKAVQEIRLPHEKDSDAICSISYHAKSGIVAVGHPTRNSIYFIHLSAPKYTLQSMEQAKYITLLARGNSALPRPESTAIMSGLREFSFNKVGQLRSVDMLKTPIDNASETGSVDETLFELYAMHSKGVVCIPIKRADLGWDAASKMISPKDALTEKVIEVSELIQPSKVQAPGDQAAVPETAPAKSAAKSATVKQPEPVKAAEPAKALPTILKADNKAERTSRDAGSAAPSATAQSAKQLAPGSTSTAVEQQSVPASSSAQRSKSPMKEKSNQTTANVAKKTIAQTPQPATSSSLIGGEEILSSITKQFDALYQRIDSERRAQDASAGAKQEALLRLVSSTLTENVDRSLHQIVSTSIEQKVLPALSDLVNKAVDKKLGEMLPQQISSSVSGAVKTNLTSSLQHVVKDKEFHRIISDTTASQAATRVSSEISSLLQGFVPKVGSQVTPKMVNDAEARTNQKLQQAEAQRVRDSAKIDELTSLVNHLSSTVERLADLQSATQEVIVKMRTESTARERAESLRDASARPETQSSQQAPAPAPAPAPAELQSDPQDDEVAAITQLLMAGEYEQATIRWISSDRQADLFDNLFIRVNMDYLDHVSPLVSLTVSAAITSSFATNVEKRLEWLEKVLGSIDIRHADIRDVAPKIMDVLSARLHSAYLSISESGPGQEKKLRSIAALDHQVSEVRRLTA